MSIVVEEKFESRFVTDGQSPSAELRYVILGTASDAAARSAVAAEAPVLYETLPRLSVEVEPLAPEIWDSTVRYGAAQAAPVTGESAFSFDTGGGTQHITHSRATVGIYAPPGETAPDFQGAIGVTDAGVEGIDATIPVYQFSETHYIDAALVTDAYKGTLFALTGRVNASLFKGLAAGECLFLGASGAQRGSDDWEITFRFAGSPNVVDLAVGPITGISKLGWEYLWVRYGDAVDDVAQKLVKRPIGAYVEQIYLPGDFSLLGIGT